MMDSSSEPSQERYQVSHAHHGSLMALAVGALGVVFGDIGTSPLYAFKACIDAMGDMATREDVVLGMCSLVFWALSIIVTLKYVSLVLRADNRGEGGVLALTALVVLEGRPKWPFLIGILGLAGCAFFYGDGTITPAVSVLSAIEGLELVDPLFKTWVVPLSVVVLLALFFVQKRGTGSIGAFFGPIMLVWFVVIGLMGLNQIILHPVVLLALSPHHAISVLVAHPGLSMALISAVFLAMTGGEALYADLGHFGAKPIRAIWYFLVWPSLILNYFGQGALILGNPQATESPFYLMAPDYLLLPLVILATMATIIASQAVISGVFSMTQQAIQLGFLPRMKVMQTSDTSIGQIYVPVVNGVLCLATIGLVLSFRSSDSLAGAYGIAVVCTMLITAILMDHLFLHRARLDSKNWVLFFLALPLAFIDAVFLASNIDKIPQGGWFPLACGFTVFVLMRTWLRGRHLFNEQVKRLERSLESFLEEIRQQPPLIV
jgi:KUP system potassium uptake protein